MLGSPAQSDSVRGALRLLGAGQSHLPSEGDCMTSRGSVNRLCFSLYISYWHWYLGSICHRYNQANCLADCCNTLHIYLVLTFYITHWFSQLTTLSFAKHGQKCLDNTLPLTYLCSSSNVFGSTSLHKSLANIPIV